MPIRDNRLLMRAALIAAFVVLLNGCDGGPQNGIAAVVNGYKITVAELERYYASQYQGDDGPENADQAQMLRLNLLREMIDRQLLLQRAEALGLLAVDDDVDRELERYRSPFDSSDEFLASLADRNMTLEDLRTEIRRRLTIERLFNKEISTRVEVTEEEMRAYYDENLAAFTLPEQQVHLAQILVTNVEEVPVPNLRSDDATTTAEAKAKIETLLERLETGEEFGVLAENYSEDPDSTPNGGDMGFIAQSYLEKAHINLRQAVASLSPGETSEIVETDGQYRILKLLALEAAGRRDFSDPSVQQTVRDTLRNRKDQVLRAAFFDVQRSQASIRNYLAERITAQYGVSN